MLCASCSHKKQQRVITVSGLGTVMAQPDTVQMRVSLNKTAPTTSEAQREVNQQVRQALAILQDAGVDEKNISTASLRFYPEYDWGNNQRILAGQKAEQVITFSTGSIDSGNVTNIIDQLIQINGIELQQTHFYIKDNAELYARSRELAYRDAREKAGQYAGLSGYKTVKPLTITEDGVMPITPRAQMRSKGVAEFAAVQSADSGSAVLPTGEMEITSRILVEFIMK
ncbi:MAG: SIMPL domain-containing protein [Treponema sp.]|nr:SIMPL domain-containing protein [Treponema sp.]